MFTSQTCTNRWLWASLAMIAVLQVVVIQFPWLHGFFDTYALSVRKWLVCAVVVCAGLVVEEAIKALRPRAAARVT